MSKTEYIPRAESLPTAQKLKKTKKRKICKVAISQGVKMRWAIGPLLRRLKAYLEQTYSHVPNM